MSERKNTHSFELEDKSDTGRRSALFNIKQVIRDGVTYLEEGQLFAQHLAPSGEMEVVNMRVTLDELDELTEWLATELGHTIVKGGQKDGPKR